MENTYIDLSLQNLKLILIRFNENKYTRHENKKIFNVDKILSVSTRNCRYVGNDDTKNKTQLDVKFNSLDEKFKLTYPVIIKPSREGGSIGIFKDSVAENEKQLKKCMKRILDD